MGVTIYYRLGVWNRGALRETLDLAEATARMAGMATPREGEHDLIIDPGEGCETLEFRFRPWGEVKRGGWDFFGLRAGAEAGPYDGLMVCSGSCKTQWAGDMTHARVAELIRLVACRCSYVEILDEGEYYETRDRRRVLKAINESAELINELAKALSAAGFKVEKGAEVGA
jgi:hypothetical protein